MDKFKEEMVDDILNNQLSPADTFQFTCRECGECCRNRSTPIMLTGLDIYRMALGLRIDPYEVLARYTTGHLGESSHAPVVVLRERLDGSCSLLRKGKCTVHQFKPIACAVHPIGRVIDLTQKKSVYIRQSGGCSGASGGRTWTLDEWLDTWGLRELDEPSLAWNLMAGGVAMVMRNIKRSAIGQDTIWMLYQQMYGEFDVCKDFIPQVERNSEALRKFLWDKYKLKAEF